MSPNILLNMVKKRVIKGLKAVFNGEGAIEGVDVLIEGDKIVDIGEGLSAEEEVILEGKVLYPKFVDPHTHLLYAGDRFEEFKIKLEGFDYLEILKRGGGIYSTVNKTKSTSDEEVISQTLKRIKLLKDFGVGVVEIKTGYGVYFDEEIRQLRLINLLKGNSKDVLILSTLLFHVKPKDKDFDTYISEFFDRFEEYKDLVDFVDVFADEGAFNYEETERILRFYTERGFKCRLHADEFKPFGSELAGKYKCLSADHLLNPSERGLKLMAENGVIAILCPTTGFFLRKGFAPYEKIKSFGLEVALASDHNPGTSPFLNPFITLFLAVYSLGMKPTEAFMSHTYIAAKSLGLKDIGKIDVGYKAMVFAMDYTPEEWAYYGDLEPSIGFPLDRDNTQP